MIDQLDWNLGDLEISFFNYLITILTISTDKMGCGKSAPYPPAGSNHYPFATSFGYPFVQPPNVPIPAPARPEIPPITILPPTSQGKPGLPGTAFPGANPIYR
jgi:hypothetical protein